jgi:O-antigen/teichoic acid export membrane protein
MFKRLPQGLIGNAAAYIFAAGLNAAIPFLLLPLIARWLGPADFGIVGSFVALVNVLILLVGLNAYGFVGVGYYRDGPQLLPRLVGAAALIIAVSSTITGVVIWIGAGPIERLTGVDRAWLWTFPAAAAGQAVIAVGLAVAQTIQRPLAYGALQIGYGLTLAVLALLLIGAFDMGWSGRALAQALAAIVVSSGAFLWLASTGRMTIRVGRDMVGQALGFGVPLLPHSLAAVAMGSMDRLALTGAFSAAVVGHYFLALQIASVFTALAAAVNQAWVPWLYARLAKNDAEAWTEITQVIQIGGLLLVAAAILMAALAGVLTAMVGGHQFAPAAGPLRILSFYAAFQAWYSLMSAFLFYAKRPKLLSLLTVSSAVLQGVLILLFLRWGASGVAAALLLTSAVSAVAISFVVRRYAVRHRASTPSTKLAS